MYAIKNPLVENDTIVGTPIKEKCDIDQRTTFYPLILKTKEDWKKVSVFCRKGAYKTRNNSGYDCSGKMCAVDVEYDFTMGGIVVITYYDC